MTDIASIPIEQGEQVWVFMRTDRDGASADEIASSIGDLMRWVLRNAKTAETGIADLHQVVSTGDREWRVGAARPVQLVSVGHQRPTYPMGKTIAARENYPGDGIPTVSGTNPWWVVVRFWWRAAKTEVQWPTLLAAVGSLTGFNVAAYTIDQADWALDRAIVPAATDKDPGDASWGTVQGARAAQAAGTVLSVSGKVLGVVALAAAVVVVLRARMRR